MELYFAKPVLLSLIILVSIILILLLFIFWIYLGSTQAEYTSYNYVVHSSIKRQGFCLNKAKDKINALSIGNPRHEKYLNDFYPNIYIQKTGEKIINISKDNIFQYAKQDHSVLSSHIFPKDSLFYDIGKEVRIVTSNDRKKILYLSIQSNKEDKLIWKIGLDEKNMQSLPMSVKDLQNIFGKGRITRHFYK